MHRIDTPNKAVDLFGAGKHGFRDGVLPAVNPTEFNASFFNTIQEELAGIVEAAGLVLDANSSVQLLAALRSAGVFQTAPQFDNSTKPATTAFTKSAGKRFGGIISVLANGALTAASVGKLTLISGNGLIVDLPAANTVPVGECVTIAGAGWVSGNTIQRSTGTADAIYPNGVAGGITSFTLDYGDTVTLVSNGVANWYVAEGSAMRGVGCSAQTEQNLTLSRSLTTIYTNSTGRPIEVSVSVTNTAATAFGFILTTGGLNKQINVQNSLPAGNSILSLTGIVRPGDTYSVTGNAASIAMWNEKR